MKRSVLFLLLTLGVGAVFGAITRSALADSWYKSGAPVQVTTANPLPVAIGTPGYPTWGADIAVTVTGTSTTSGLAALTAGAYVVTCSTLSHGDQGITGVVATTSERTIPANMPYPIRVTGATDNYLALIRDTTSGTCIVSADGY